MKSYYNDRLVDGSDIIVMRVIAKLGFDPRLCKNNENLGFLPINKKITLSLVVPQFVTG